MPTSVGKRIGSEVAVKNRVSKNLRRYRVYLGVVAGNGLFAAIFLAVALSWFHQPTPHEIPVGLVAPAPIEQSIRGGLERHLPGLFVLRPLSGEHQARVEIEHRTLDGAVVVSARSMTLLTAGAGGVAPMQAITAAFTSLAAHRGQSLTTADVVPPARGDSKGLSAYFLILCVLFPSLAAGVAAGHLLRRAPVASRTAVLTGLAGVVGLVAAGIGDGISGLGHYWAIAGIIALFSLAISAPTAALGQIRPQLVALAVLVFVVFGIPVSGGPANFAAFGPDFLRWLSSILPLGVAAGAVRNTVYFNAADTATRLLVLSAFAAAGLGVLWVLAGIARRRNPVAPALATPSAAERPLSRTVPTPGGSGGAALVAPAKLHPQA
jgi:hypothetical protein